MTPVFPLNFIKNQGNKSFYIRLLPNLTNIGLSDNIVESTPAVRKTTFGDRPQRRYFSYAFIKEWGDMNKYVKDQVCVFQYGKSVHDAIIEFMGEKQKNLFDLGCDYSLYLKVTHKYTYHAGPGLDGLNDGYPDYEVYFNQSYDNIIYDVSQRKESDKEKIKTLLLNRDYNIEQLAINSSIEPYKSDLEKRYIQLLRDDKLNKIIKY